VATVSKEWPRLVGSIKVKFWLLAVCRNGRGGVADNNVSPNNVLIKVNSLLSPSYYTNVPQYSPPLGPWCVDPWCVDAYHELQRKRRHNNVPLITMSHNKRPCNNNVPQQRPNNVPHIENAQRIMFLRDTQIEEAPVDGGAITIMCS
jgi:hypothetical protein